MVVFQVYLVFYLCLDLFHNLASSIFFILFTTLNPNKTQKLKLNQNVVKSWNSTVESAKNIQCLFLGNSWNKVEYCKSSWNKIEYGASDREQTLIFSLSVKHKICLLPVEMKLNSDTRNVFTSSESIQLLLALI